MQEGSGVDRLTANKIEDSWKLLKEQVGAMLDELQLTGRAIASCSLQAAL